MTPPAESILNFLIGPFLNLPICHASGPSRVTVEETIKLPVDHFSQSLFQLLLHLFV
jgi:hypothetical protein